ncbi:MAG: response regulator [Chloroflexota bacterium]|nr:response regulator [Chloroflexota bacterium]
MTHEEFVNLVRDAYTHLYDPAHLQKHPLAEALVETDDLNLVNRSQKLRHILLDALEQLRPPESASASPDTTDCYHAVHYRYLDGLSLEQIAEMLALSPRQTYRKIREGMEAIASLLVDRFCLDSSLDAPFEAEMGETTDRRVLAKAAVDHLGAYAQAEVIDLGAVLATIVKDLQLFCRRIGAEIRLAAPHSPLFVYADRTLLRQALINLLSNMLDNTAGQTLTLEATEAHAEALLNLYARPAAARPAARRDETDRQGIGLDVAMRLFDMQGIRIERSATDEGWRITIRIPQAGPQHILVIDDMPDVPRLFQRYAKSYAIEIVSAGNADQAFDVLEHVTPRLILLDVMLPHRDGWEILQTLKSDPSTAPIPVVVCSILNEPELALSLGADDYLGKPVSQEAYLKMLARWIRLDPRPDAVQP